MTKDKKDAPKADTKAVKATKAAAAKEAAPKKEPKAKKVAVARPDHKGPISLRLYDVLVSPLITEKSTRHAELNKVVFKISPTATKVDVRRAVEALFNVTVTKVNTINVEGKEKRFKGRIGHRQDVRKAIVTLAAGQSIDFAAGR